MPDAVELAVQERTAQLTRENLRLRAEVNERRQVERVLRAVLEGAPLVGGDALFGALARQLAEVINADAVCLAELTGGRTERVQTLALWADGGMAAPLEFVLTGSILERIVTDGVERLGIGDHHGWPHDPLLSRWPAEVGCGAVLRDAQAQPVGVLLALYRAGRVPPHDVESILRIFAARAGAEIERSRADARLREREAHVAHAARLSTMGEMAAGIAHEVNQPLSVIANYAETSLNQIHSGRHDVGALAESFERIVAQAERAAQIIRRVRKFTRKYPLQDTLDINDTLRDVIELLQSTLRSGGVTVEMLLAPDLPGVYADRVQIEQVLVNLVRNAVEAVQEVPRGRRRISIRSRCAGSDHVEVIVSDSGPGVPEELQEAVFEPFSTTKTDGLGMGLSISRSIIEAHHGQLWVEASQGPGARFGFRLPIVQESVQ